MNKGVSTKTQEEWDFVISKFNPKLLNKHEWSCYKEKTFITTYNSYKSFIGCYGVTTSGYTIISFDEWCKENGHTPKLEIFPGIFVGDVVVSLENVGESMRMNGDIVIVSDNSKKDSLKYIGREKKERNTSELFSFRLATPLEAEAFRNGITNINDMKKEEVTPQFEVGKWYKVRGIDGYWKFKSKGEHGYMNAFCSIYMRVYKEGGEIQNDSWFKCDELTDLSEVQSYLPEGHVDKQPVDLIGRYVKALEDAPYAGSVKEGEYALIVRENASEYVVDFPSHKSYFIRKTCIPSSRIELMPVGFEPEAEVKEEWIPEIGEFVVTQGYSHEYDGRVLRINKIDGEYCYFDVFDGGYHSKSSNFSYKSDKVRQATQAEKDSIIYSKKREIFSKEEDLLAEAKRRYPVGTKFIDARDPHFNYGSDRQTIIKGDELRIWSKTPIEIDAHRRGFVYSDGKWAEIVESPKTVEKSSLVHDLDRCEEIKTEEKWQVGGYVRLIIDYKNYSKGAICKIKNYCSNNYGRAIIEIEDGSLLWEDTECEWVGMQKPVEYPVWNSYQKDDFHYITGIDSYCKTSDECYQKYEVIKTTEPIILKKQQKINYLNV